MIEKIDKIEAARRQLDTAIDLYFNEGDSLSCFTLSYASLKLLFDLYCWRAFKTDHLCALNFDQAFLHRI